jgi:hypothetical protein
VVFSGLFRAVFRGRFWHGGEETAWIIDCSFSATKSFTHRGRETFKQKLKPHLQTGEWSG